MLTFKTKLRHQPICLPCYTTAPTRQLRSSSAAGLLKKLTISTKISDRAFSAAAVKIWHDIGYPSDYIGLRSATASLDSTVCSASQDSYLFHLFALSFH